MNTDKLRQAEARFLGSYPGGFADPGMAHIKKKHDVDKLVAFAQEQLSRASCSRPEQFCESLVKLISRSSMVSRFEKPKFRDCIRSFNSQEKQQLALAYEKLLYGRAKAQGFADIVSLLQRYGIAKWPVVSAAPFYLFPDREAFVKPTTAKRILAFLEVDELRYQAAPSWEFYRGYRDVLKAVKQEVVSSLAPNYAALSGFLMVSMET
jgi:hypothetical protein